MKQKYKWLIGSIFILSLSLPVSAKEKKETTKYAFDLGVGLNTIVPYGAATFHIHPQQTGNFSWNASLQMGRTFSKTNSGGINVIGILGTRYLFITEGIFQPFIGGGLGFSSSGIFPLIGLGSDFMINDKFGLSLGISSGISSIMSGTLVFRPELSAKWKW